MSEPDVSVIIPTWNRAPLLGEAVESALAQTHSGCEVIVVDDGSTDETPKVLARFEGRIRVLRQAQRGCACARNAGGALARGEYLVFLDSDDRLDPEHVALLLPVLKADPLVGFAYSDGRYMGADGRPLEPAPAMSGVPVEVGFAETFFERPYVYMPATLIRARAIHAVGGFDETLSHNEDSDLLLRMAMRFPVRYVPAPTVWVRQHPGRKSSDRPALYLALLASACRAATDPGFAARLGGRLPRRLGELHHGLGRVLLGEGRLAEAREAFRAGRAILGSGTWRVRAWMFSMVFAMGDLPARAVFKCLHLWERATQLSLAGGKR
ncbi:MAG: glycosyltransferase family 2 protein [candidate division NC10 bacterium]|nr:glycosyltransferase family 2 protein [candidate division NC10 bacterium]